MISSVVSAFLVSLCLGSTATATMTYRGVDWSTVKVMEASGITYKDTANNPKPLEQILVDSGVNTVRQRVFVNPADGNYNLAYNIELAKRARAVGMEIYLNLHYSDTWGDPRSQVIPAGWPTDIDGLVAKIYTYTKEVCDAFESAGIQPVIISLGNEITAGLLYPVAFWPEFNNMARLLKAASNGVKESTLSKKPKIQLHLDNGWAHETQDLFYTSVLQQGPLTVNDFDQMAVSFYPYYSEWCTFANLTTTLQTLSRKWGKEILVVETNWPVICNNPDLTMPFDVRQIPFSTDGQVQFTNSVVNLLKTIPKGIGFFMWEVGWVTFPSLSGPCADNLLFEPDGRARSSIDMFKSI